MPLGRERATVHGSNVEHGAFPAVAAPHLQAALKREPAPPAEPRRLGVAALLHDFAATKPSTKLYIQRALVCERATQYT